ncbi:NADH-quinone oxidoreductase subunit J [Pajaroellobacter abortibovis]|uniref:NADH-quinone oxidoreductase subunit J n=1 Tax=Pajaroellobacter abortibovis TaxID=1882918 RepID=A0A1L6MXN2_9BACT|nr:NADH-quinone oxidoreductase subunit J [Pajaroellobacter abortibovis]APS00205.1 hypothetical protein BCY86_05550 [Pajaroellobacter abortibovis]
MSEATSIYFYGCSGIALAGALITSASSNPIRSAMGLMMVIVAIAALFLPLHAEFLAAIQLMVYAGAVVVLFLFIIMLLGEGAISEDKRNISWIRRLSPLVFLIPWIAAIGMFTKHPDVLPSFELLTDHFGTIEGISHTLFEQELIPFEYSSALLIVAALGAFTVARGKTILPLSQPSPSHYESQGS